MREAIGDPDMNALYLVVGFMALALFIYLVVALLKPESF